MIGDEALTPLLYGTARIAAALFLFAFVTRRRALVLAFVAAHLVHLGVIIAAAMGPARERFLASWPVTIVGGGIVYALILAIGVRAWMRAAPSWFDTVAYFVAWAAFARPLIARAVSLRTPLHVAFAVAYVLALVVVIARAASPTCKSSRAPASI